MSSAFRFEAFVAMELGARMRLDVRTLIDDVTTLMLGAGGAGGMTLEKAVASLPIGKYLSLDPADGNSADGNRASGSSSPTKGN